MIAATARKLGNGGGWATRQATPGQSTARGPGGAGSGRLAQGGVVEEPPLVVEGLDVELAPRQVT